MGRLPGILLVSVTLSVAAAMTGCGEISKAGEASNLSSALAAATYLPSSVDKAALVNCVVSKLYDSGTFTPDEVQRIVTANNIMDLDKPLQAKFTTNVVMPCDEQAFGGASSSSTSAASSAATT